MFRSFCGGLLARGCNIVSCPWRAVCGLRACWYFLSLSGSESDARPSVCTFVCRINCRRETRGLRVPQSSWLLSVVFGDELAGFDYDTLIGGRVSFSVVVLYGVVVVVVMVFHFLCELRRFPFCFCLLRVCFSFGIHFSVLCVPTACVCLGRSERGGNTLACWLLRAASERASEMLMWTA